MTPPGIHVRLELRDLPRLLALVWELRQLEHRLRLAGSPEADALERALARFLADIGADEASPPA